MSTSQSRMRMAVMASAQQSLLLAHNVNIRTIRVLFSRVTMNPNYKTIQGLRRAINFQMRLHTYINESFGGVRIDIRMRLDEELEGLSQIAMRLDEIEELVKTSMDVTEEFYHEQRDRLKNKYSNMILIIGSTGVGKTMCARNVATEMDKGFILTRDTFFLGTDFLSKIKESQRGKYLIFDEPVVELGARRGMEKARPEINAVFTVFRIRQINILLATPFPEDVDKADRKLIWALLHVVDRGIALWYEPPQFGTDPKDFSNWVLKGRVYFENMEDEAWAAYETEKNKFIDTIIHRAEKRIAEREGKPDIDRKKMITELIEKAKVWLKQERIKKPKYEHIHEFLMLEASDDERKLVKDPKDEKVLLNRVLRGQPIPVEISKRLNTLKVDIGAKVKGLE